MIKTTLGNLLVNEALPDDLKDYSRILDKKGTGKLFQEIAEKYPEQYKSIAKRLSDIGRDAATESGTYSFGLDSLITPDKIVQMKQDMQNSVDKILRDKKLDDRARQTSIIETLQKKAKELEDTLYQELLKSKNPLALQVASGARGNPGNLRSLLGGDLLYEDHRGRIIPVPVLHSYSQGLSPVEYWAGTFGTRKGIADLKTATADAGFFGKQLNQMTHRLVIAARDADKEEGTLRGMPIDIDDPDNEGAFLAQGVGKYKRNTLLTPKVLADIKNKGHDRILVRSAITGGHPDGGLYGYDVGVRERGGLPTTGDNVGMAAAQALSEPLTQAQISSKHLGGVAGAGGAISGFKYINQIVQVPKTFTGGATHADTDGKVGATYDAPAGGKYMMINGHRHYIGTGLEPTVKPGDIVEAGDLLSDGLPNPAKIVEHKGVGEGRRYFVDIMRKLYKDSNLKIHRRNAELISRGLINHVELTDEMGDYMPGDIVPYDLLEKHYIPRPGHSIVPSKNAKDKYLERPVLHYSIGTKIRPSIQKELKNFGVDNIIVHNEPPPFQPRMVRAMENLLHDPDWMTKQLGTTSLRKGLLQSAHRGSTSNELGTSFVPGLARAESFGHIGKTKGWNPKEVVKMEMPKPEPEEFES